MCLQGRLSTTKKDLLLSGESLHRGLCGRIHLLGVTACGSLAQLCGDHVSAWPAMDGLQMASAKSVVCGEFNTSDHGYAYYTELNYSDYGVDYGDESGGGVYEDLADVLQRRVLVAICAFGLIGNAFNLLVLVPIGIRSQLARIEKCAYLGLVALAVSDLCFCLLVIPNCCVTVGVHTSINFELIYTAYNNALINVFVLTSTWLTVTMAIGRYLATCHPLWAREIIGPTIAKRTIVVVCIVCVLLNIPRFWVNEIKYIQCDNGERVYYFQHGYLQNSPTFEAIYNWFYFAIGIAIPFVILIVSNVCLIRALRMSQAARRLFRAADHCDPNRVITLTMVIIIVMYISLVTPAEVIHFLVEFMDHSHNQRYNLVVIIVNTMQAVNFSFNFVLYFAINVSFRRCMFRMLCCCARRSATRSRVSHRGSSTTFFRRSSRPMSSANGNYSTVLSGVNMMEMTG